MYRIVIFKCQVVMPFGLITPNHQTKVNDIFPPHAYIDYDSGIVEAYENYAQSRDPKTFPYPRKYLIEPPHLPVSSKLSLFLHYIQSKPHKIPKVVKYLERKSRSDLNHGNYFASFVSLNIISAIIDSWCGPSSRDKRLFVSDIKIPVIQMLHLYICSIITPPAPLDAKILQIFNLYCTKIFGTDSLIKSSRVSSVSVSFIDSLVTETYQNDFTSNTSSANDLGDFISNVSISDQFDTLFGDICNTLVNLCKKDTMEVSTITRSIHDRDSYQTLLWSSVQSSMLVDDLETWSLSYLTNRIYTENGASSELSIPYSGNRPLPIPHCHIEKVYLSNKLLDYVFPKEKSTQDKCISKVHERILCIVIEYCCKQSETVISAIMRIIFRSWKSRVMYICKNEVHDTDSTSKIITFVKCNWITVMRKILSTCHDTQVNVIPLIITDTCQEILCIKYEGESKSNYLTIMIIFVTCLFDIPSGNDKPLIWLTRSFKSSVHFITTLRAMLFCLSCYVQDPSNQSFFQLLKDLLRWIVIASDHYSGSRKEIISFLNKRIFTLEVMNEHDNINPNIGNWRAFPRRTQTLKLQGYDGKLHDEHHEDDTEDIKRNDTPSLSTLSQPMPIVEKSDDNVDKAVKTSKAMSTYTHFGNQTSKAFLSLKDALETGSKHAIQHKPGDSLYRSDSRHRHMASISISSDIGIPTSFSTVSDYKHIASNIDDSYPAATSKLSVSSISSSYGKASSTSANSLLGQKVLENEDTRQFYVKCLQEMIRYATQ